MQNSWDFIRVKFLCENSHTNFMYILGIFVHVELLNKIMENIKRNQLLWIPINCSRSVSGISLGFYYNSYYVRCDWLIDGRYSAIRTPHLIGPY